MNSKNLALKFTFFVALPLAVSLLLIFHFKPPKLGIDLRGGHSMIFQIRTNQGEIRDIEQRREKLQEDLGKAAEGDKPAIQTQIDQATTRINELRAAQPDRENLSDEMISTLKDRIDPTGLLSIEWRPLKDNRIEVRMPAASKQAQTAKQAYLTAIDDLQRGNIPAGTIHRVIKASQQDRPGILKGIAGLSDQDAKHLNETAAVQQQLDKARAELADVLKQLDAAGEDEAQLKPLREKRSDLEVQVARLQKDVKERTETLTNRNVDTSRLEAVLRLYVSRQEAKAIDNPTRAEQRMKEFNEGLKAITDAHPSRKADVDKIVGLYKKWAETRAELDDPSDLKRLIAKAGVLEFRIAPRVGEEQAIGIDVMQARRDLQEFGPDPARMRSKDYAWFPIRGETEDFLGLIMDQWAGKTYILLSNRSGETMLQQASARSWSLADARPDRDELGRPAVGFSFDPRGAEEFLKLTGANIGKPMAILLDDEVYSSPSIRQAIGERGIISGKFSDKEVAELVRTLKAGSLPAKLDPNPVSESTFGPSLGEENLDMAKTAAKWSLVAVAAFMIVYYHWAGLVAFLAMSMNLLLILGTMCALDAVFTLPGIAGLILTMGMSVDANVLIYERLREEQAKGQSIRMAMKNAYDRAFSAIFDSNLTTLLICVILGWIATEEVKGFAITLGLGVLFNLFTAVFVTKWLYQFLLEKNILRKQMSMLKLISVPKIDWMRKRYYFWMFSLVTAVLGVAALIGQGKDIWGIDFSAGTKAIVRFKDDALVNGKLPDDGLVSTTLTQAAQQMRDGTNDPTTRAELDKFLATVRVEQVISPNRVDDFYREHFRDVEGGKIDLNQWKASGLDAAAFGQLDANSDGSLTRDEVSKNLRSPAYQLSTTATDVSIIRQITTRAYPQALVTRSRSNFDYSAGTKVAGVDLTADGATRITEKLIDAADREQSLLASELPNFIDGMVLVAQNVSPAMNKAELMSRIREMRLQPDFLSSNVTEVVGLGQPGSKGEHSSFAIMVRPSTAVEDERAWADFAEKEMRLIREAFHREEAIEAINFDPAIASDTAKRAVMAMLLGWMAIIAYLWLRFGSAQWGLAAVICVVHDLLVVVGLVGISGFIHDTVVGRALLVDSFKIDLTMVAAMLTIIGYSVNDTIVVFDRIRENRGKLTGISPRIIDTSINQTLSRTLLTGLTTVFVILIMYTFGGAGIHGFNYALLLGILFGTYSSIAVASPLLMGFKGALIAKLAPSDEAPADVTQ